MTAVPAPGADFYAFSSTTEVDDEAQGYIQSVAAGTIQTNRCHIQAKRGTRVRKSESLYDVVFRRREPRRGRMEPTTLAGAIMTSLQFNATLITLIIGFNGFAVGRLWPEVRLKPPWRLVWLLPGVVVTGWSLSVVLVRYREVAAALSRNAVLEYYTAWLNDYWNVYVWLAAAMFLSVVGFGITLKQGE
jgi:hypothetical protein